MPHYNLALLGFGNVGRALASLLEEKSEVLQTHHGVTWRITGIASRRTGWRAAPEGLDLNHLATSPFAPPDLRQWLAAARADVMFELTSLDAHTGQPAIDYIRAALESGVHVVTANKGPIVHAYRELNDLAAARGKAFYFESTVMGGTPVFSLFRAALPATRLLAFRGLLNSTTSIILGHIEAGHTFAEGVRHAQDVGIAETDPSADIDGWDTAVKICALANVLMLGPDETPLKPGNLDITGIRGLDAADVHAAFQSGRKWRLVGSAAREGGRVVGRVRPELLGPGDVLHAASGQAMAANFQTDVFHKGLTVIENDGTVQTTAYGVLADFISVTRV